MDYKAQEDKQVITVHVKFSKEMLDKVRAEAKKKGIPLATYIKFVIAEKLED